MTGMLQEKLQEKAVTPLPAISRPRTRRTALNWPLMLGTLLVVGVLVIVGTVRYTSQLDRSVTTFLQQADQLEQDGQWLKAANYLYRYLQFRPADAQVWQRLAATYAKGASTYGQKERAIEFHHRALALVERLGQAAPQARQELTTRLANIHLELGLVKEAQSLAEKELQANPTAPEYIRIRAISLYQQSRSRDQQFREGVFSQLVEALKVLPGDVQLAGYAAMLAREELTAGRPEDRQRQADNLIDAAVQADVNQTNADAFLARYRYRTEYALPGAEEDLQRAIDLGPENVNVLVEAAANALRQARLVMGPGGEDQSKTQLARAAEYYQRAIQLEPSQPLGYIGLGQVRMHQRRTEEACAVWQQGLENVSGQKLDLYRHLADALITRKQFDNAKTIIETNLAPAIAQLADRGGLSFKQKALLQGQVDLLRAKLFDGQGEPLKALAHLQQLRRIYQNMAATPQQVSADIETLSLMGRVYAGLQRWHEAADTYQQILQYTPESVSTILSTAHAWRMADNVKKELELYERLVELNNVPPSAWLRLAEIRLQEQLGLAGAERDWTEYQQAFERAAAALPDSWRIAYLAAHAALVQHPEQGRAEAVGYLAKAEALAPEHPPLWQRLVLLYEQMGRTDDANRALEHYAKIAPNRAAHALVHARLLAARGQRDQALELVSRTLSQVDADQRSTLRWEAVRLHVDAENLDAAQQALRELAADRPNDLRVVAPLAELALRKGDLPEAERLENQLRQIEGTNGVWWRFIRAGRLLKDPSAEALEEVVRLQAEIQSARPDWHPGHTLKGDLLVAEKRFDEAIESYRRAIELGGGGILLYEQLIRLLVGAGKLLEAEEYLARLKTLEGDQGSFSSEFNSLSVSLATQLDRLPVALRRARQWVDDQPDDVTGWIWLGHVLTLTGQEDEAEEVLLEATRRGQRDVRTWNALFSFYLGRDQKAAQETLEKLAEKSDLNDRRRSVALARGNEQLGNTEEAEKWYREAIRLDPEDIPIRLRLAALLSRSDLANAEKELRQLLELHPDSRPARRMLAALEATRHGEDAWAEVEELLGSAGQQGAEADQDRRLEARLLARFGGRENQAKARRVLESVVLRDGAPAANDRLLLARLYELEGNKEGARTQYFALANERGRGPVDLAHYVGFLLREQDVRESARQLEELDLLTRDAGYQQRMLFVALKGRWLRAVGRPEAIPALVDQLAGSINLPADRPRDRAWLYAQIGNLFSSLQMHDHAEPWLRKLVSVQPNAYASLARSLCILNRHQEAIDLYLANQPDPLTAEFVQNVAVVLTINEPPAEVFARAEPVLKAALDQLGENADVLVAIATAFVVEERYAESAELFEKANQLRPRYLVTLNNLATLLGEMPGQENKALEYINEAIEVAGEQSVLLDTKGMILIRLGDVPQAVKTLEQAVAEPSSDPRFHFHLAVAYDRSGAGDDARRTLATALSNGLESSILTKQDKQLLGDLKRKLMGT